ncbi:MAG: RICIN domain-containing protein, partial [Coriobacteriales bacterium]|nr:RICIN domain-containing protein [Coriobacteriales bacterium]
ERTGGANQSWDIAPITPSLADGTYTICTAGAGNRSLDVEGASLQDGARMLLWDFHGQTNQQFTIHFLPETGYYTIVGLASQKSVDVFGNSTASGTQIIQWTLHRQLNQQWSIADSGAGNGTRAIIGARNNLSLDVFGGNVANNGRIIAWPYHGQYNQQWLFDAVG